ncbi:MAG: OsmC family protein [Planctomycetota bacterium]
MLERVASRWNTKGPAHVQPSMTDTSPQPDALVSIGADSFRTEVRVDGHTFIADEPADVGGTNEGPTPVQLALAALGACKVMTARMYAARKGWPLEGVVASVDRADRPEPGASQPAIRVELQLLGDLADDQRDRLKDIAGRCPVSKMIREATPVEATLTLPE